MWKKLQETWGESASLLEKQESERLLAEQASMANSIDIKGWKATKLCTA